MNKTIFVGDIHTKQFILNSIKKLLEEDKQIDKVIFVGDYVDEWGGNEKENLDILDSLFDLKRKYMDKIVLLLGNHDLSYMGYPCSGHVFPDDLIIQKYKDNHNLLQVFYYDLDSNYIVSHGGITNNWWLLIKQFYSGTMEEILEKINKDFQNVDSEEYQQLLELLSIASRTSGAYSLCASCLWARPQDHLCFPLNLKINQIVGHTPISGNIEQHIGKTGISKENLIYYIDTFSTYKDRTPYGKQEVLVNNGNNFIAAQLPLTNK